MASNASESLPVFTQPVTEQQGLVNRVWRIFFLNIWNRVRNLAQQIGWANPPFTGSGSRASFDADWTTAVSNPPTQAEVTAIRNQTVILQKRLAALIEDMTTNQLIGP